MGVYSLHCFTCNKKYIGSTIRPFHTRFNEHHNRKDGIISNHWKQCPHPNFIPEFNELIRRDNEIEVRIREALTIRENRPELNGKEEIVELLNTIF